MPREIFFFSVHSTAYELTRITNVLLLGQQPTQLPNKTTTANLLFKGYHNQPAHTSFFLKILNWLVRLPAQKKIQIRKDGHHRTLPARKSIPQFDKINTIVLNSGFGGQPHSTSSGHCHIRKIENRYNANGCRRFSLDSGWCLSAFSRSRLEST